MKKITCGTVVECVKSSNASQVGQRYTVYAVYPAMIADGYSYQARSVIDGTCVGFDGDQIRPVVER